MLSPPRPLKPLRGMRFLTDWLNQLREYVLTLNIVSGYNVQVRRTSAGLALIGTAEAEESAGTTVGMFKVKSVQGDWITCRTWDAVNQVEGDTDVIIAKPYKLRTSLTKEAKFGVVHTYSYADEAAYGGDNQVRTDRNLSTNTTERQLVTPPWTVAATINVLGTDHVCPAEIIYAIKCTTGVWDTPSHEVEWLHFSPSRQWARL